MRHAITDVFSRLPVGRLSASMGCALLSAGSVALLSGCSSQDFGRPVGHRIGDAFDSRQSYAVSVDEEEVKARTERLAKALVVWEEQKKNVDKDYTIGPDDLIEVSVLALEEPGRISKIERPVTKNGEINLPLIGSVKAASRSSREVEQDVASKLNGRYLKDPQVTVRVADYRSAPVVVTGTVGKPGVYYLKRNESSVLELLSEAGGLTVGAGDLLHIIRRRKAGEAAPVAPLGATVTTTLPGAPRAPIPAGTSNAAPVQVSPSAETNAPAAPVPAEASGACPAAAAADTNAPAAAPRRSFWSRLFGAGQKASSPAPGVATDIDASPVAGVSVAAPALAPAAGVAPTNVPAPSAPTLPVLTEQEVRLQVAQALVAQETAAGTNAAVSAQTNMARIAFSALDERASVSETSDVLSLDLRQLLDDGDVRLNLAVRGGDIISVPPGKEKYIQVLGYVQRPGAFELRGRKEMEVMQALAMAGGLATAGRAENSVLMRETSNGRDVIDVNLTKIAGGVRPPLYMIAGDTLIVGSSWLARMAEFVKPNASIGAAVNPIP